MKPYPYRGIIFRIDLFSVGFSVGYYCAGVWWNSFVLSGSCGHTKRRVVK